MMITVEEIDKAARLEAAAILEKFAESLQSAVRDLLAAAYVAGANHVIESMADQVEEEATNAHS